MALGTGWWLLLGREGDASPLAGVLGVADATLHVDAGWLLVALSLAGALAGRRATRTFVVESLRRDPGDARWLATWPRAALTGRFEPHRGHFDPGQRIANVVMAVLIAVVVASGAGLAAVHGGPAFVWLGRVHRWSTYLLTPVLAGHVVVASGALPGYRGVWRAMHLGGRVEPRVARRLWPEWAARRDV